MRIDPEWVVGRFASKIDWHYERFVSFGSLARGGLRVGEDSRGRTREPGGTYTGDE